MTQAEVDRLLHREVARREKDGTDLDRRAVTVSPVRCPTSPARSPEVNQVRQSLLKALVSTSGRDSAVEEGFDQVKKHV